MPTGYSFDNYVVPEDQWGKVVTADDMRFTYMFGIDAVAQDINETIWMDSQYDFFVNGAVAEFEKYLTIDIRKRIYKTPSIEMDGDSLASLTRGRKVGPGVDYTDLEDTYPFIPANWNRYGFIQLRHSPIISVERAILNNAIGSRLFDLKGNGWLRLNRRATGQINFYPAGRTFTFTPFGGGSVTQRLLSYGIRYPGAFEIDYTSGYESSDFVPDELREIIAKYAAIKSLASIGDGLLAGFSSQSVSLDGLSESFSSTQSATSAYFGARIKQYRDEIADWLKLNRYKYGQIPIGFIA